MREKQSVQTCVDHKCDRNGILVSQVRRGEKIRAGVA